MGLYERLPYTNFHELNITWILGELKKAVTEFERAQKDYADLYTYVHDYFDNLDLSAEISAKIEELILDGTMADLIASITNPRLNIKYQVPVFNDTTFAAALHNALDHSNLVYVPSGNYNVDTIGQIDISGDADIVFDDGAHFYVSAMKDRFMFFDGGNVRLRGGVWNFASGSDMKNALFLSEAEGGRGYNGATFYFKNAKSVTFEGFEAHNPRHMTFAFFEDCSNVTVKNNLLRDVVFSGFRVGNSGQNIVFENNVIENVYIPQNIPGVYYCYGIGSGLLHLTDSNITPPDNIVFRNNIIKRSEDSGIDTHGATNVLIENNVVENCNTAITAYNDSNRVQRPAGWVMDNVVIRNNKCVSDYINGLNQHPYLILGSFNAQARDCSNMVLENNVFISNNVLPTYGNALCYVSRVKGLVLSNNRMETNGRYGIVLSRVSDATLQSNSVKALYYMLVAPGTNCELVSGEEVGGNGLDTIVQDTAPFSYVSWPNKSRYAAGTARMLHFGEFTNDQYGAISITAGLCQNYPNDYSFDMVLDAGVLTSSTPVYFVKGQALSVGSRTAEIAEILSDYSVRVVINGSVSGGPVTVTATRAKLNLGKNIPTAWTTDLNDAPIGMVTIDRTVPNEPTSFTYAYSLYTKLRMGGNQKTQIAEVLNRMFIRSQDSGMNWSAWREL